MTTSKDFLPLIDLSNTIFTGEVKDLVLNATLFVYQDAEGVKYTTWGGGYINEREKELADIVHQNVKENYELTFTGETVTVEKLGDYVATHYTEAELLDQVLFGIEANYFRKEV